MALSEGLKGFVNFFTKSFNEGGEDDAFMDLVDGDDGYETEGTLALNRDIKSCFSPKFIQIRRSYCD